MRDDGGDRSGRGARDGGSTRRRDFPLARIGPHRRRRCVVVGGERSSDGVGVVPDGFGADGHGWIPQERGSLLATRDGGRRWHDLAITEPEVRLALSASLVSAEAGFAVIRDGRRQRYELDRTNDGGRTWHLVHAWPM